MSGSRLHTYSTERKKSFLNPTPPSLPCRPFAPGWETSDLISKRPSSWSLSGTGTGTGYNGQTVTPLLKYQTKWIRCLRLHLCHGLQTISALSYPRVRHKMFVTLEVYHGL